MKTILTACVLLGATAMTGEAFASDYDVSGRPQRVIVHKEECNDDDWYDWQPWTTGTITFEEGFYGGMGYSRGIDVEKRISRDPSNPTWQMRILNYHRNVPREGDIDELIIQYDPRTKKIFIPTQDFGMRTAVEDKEGVKGIPAYITGYTTFYPDRKSDVEQFDEVEGFMRIHTLVYWDGMLLDDGKRGKYVYTESWDSFKLDGFTDYNVNILSDGCVSSTDHSVQFSFTSDPHGMCYDIVHGLVDDAKIDAIAEAKINQLTEPKSVTFNLREGLNTIVAISYDRQEKRYVNLKEIYCMPEDAEHWKAIGTGRFTEDAISGLGSDLGVPSFDVAVEESTDKPGLYRMVNPYVGFADRFSGMSHHTAHTHYLYFDATVPTQVMMTQQAAGITDEKLGEMFLTSKGYEEMMAGKMRVEYAKYLGKVDQGVISFPVEAIGVKLPDYQKDHIWWTNSSGCFGLRLPDNSGVGDILSDAEDKEYYTLQGIRVREPEAGNIYIVRSGSHVAKEIMR